MNLLRGIAVLLMVPMVAVHAQADRWVVVGGNDTFTSYVDTTHIVTEAGIRTTWTKFVYATEQTTITPDKVRFSIHLSNVSFDCKHRLIKDNAEYLTDASNKVVKSDDQIQDNWHAPIPSSIGEKQVDMVCQLK